MDFHQRYAVTKEERTLIKQRVELFWRDMHRCVTQLFYRLFYYMEYHDLLEPTNEIHLFALLKVETIME